MSFEAGSIVGSLHLDKSAFDHGLEAAKRDAEAFAARKYEAKLGVDTTAGRRDLKAFNESLTAFRQRKALASMGLADAGFRQNLAARNRDLDRFRDRKATATVDVNTARADAHLAAVNLHLDRLGRRRVTVPVDERTNRNLDRAERSTGQLWGQVNGLGAAIAAVSPLAATAGITLASMGAGAAVAFGSAAVGAGAFFAAFKSNLAPLQNINKQLAQYEKVLKSSSATTAQKASAQAKINDLLKGESAATRQAREALTGYTTAWRKFRTSLQPQSFALLSTGLTIFKRGLTAVQPAAAGAGNAINRLAKQAAGVLDPNNTSRSAVAWQHLFQMIDRNAGPVITRLGRGMGGIATGFAAMAPAFQPVITMLTTGFQRIGDTFSRWATSARGQAAFHSFADYFVRNGPILAYDLGQIARAIGHLLGQLAPIGEKALAGLQTLFQNHPGLAQTAVNLVAVGTAFKMFGGNLGTLIKPLQMVVGLLGFGGEAAGAEGLAGLLGASGPVGWAVGAAVVAIGALTAGMIALYKHSATFRGYVSQIVDGLRTAARVFMSIVAPAFAQISKALSDNSGQFRWLLVQMKPLFDFIQRYLAPAIGAELAVNLGSLALAISVVIRAISGLVALFRAGFKGVITSLQWFAGLLQTVWQWGAKAFSWIPGVGGFLSRLAGWAGSVAGALGRMRNGLTSNAAASRSVGSAAGTMAGQLLKLVTPTNSATTATGKLSASMRQANSHATTLLSSLRKLAGGDLAVMQAQDDYTAAVRRADRALVTSRGNVDGRTAADRRARKALDQEVVSGIDYIRYLKQSGASNETVRRAIIRQRDQVQKQAGDTKYGRKIIDTYNRELNSIPKTKKTNITVHGTGSFTIPKTVSGAMNTAFNLLKGIKYAGGGVARRGLASGGVARYALAGGGGAVDPTGVVHGPGGDRSDTAGLYALSRDEFVVNAPASRAFRPQLMAMNDWGNRGTGYRGQYAGGGLASPGTGQARVPALAARLPIRGGLLAGGVAGDTTATGANHTWSGNIPSLMSTVATGVNKVTSAVFTAAAATMAKKWAQIAGAYNSGAGVAGKALRAAQTQLGVPYVWGGTAWGRGMDCSALVMQSYAHAGKKIPRTSQQQYAYTRRIKMSESVPGDLIFWEGIPPGHVGMLVNHNTAINEPHTGAATRYRSTAGYVALGRVPGAASGTVPQGMGSNAKSLAYNILKQEGQQRYYQDLVRLWNRESGWNPNAVNKSSGAYGIPQALGHGHPYSLGDWAAQVRWGLNYIAGRYGTPGAAWAHEQRFGWYAKGGPVTTRWGIVGEDGPELVRFDGPATVYPHAQSMRALATGKGIPGFASGGTINHTPAAAKKKVSPETWKQIEAIGQGLTKILYASLTGSQSQIAKAGQQIRDDLVKAFVRRPHHHAVAVAAAEVRQLEAFARRRDAVNAKITSAQSVFTAARQTGTDYGQLTNLGTVYNAATVQQSLANQVQGVARFAGQIKQLKKLGLSNALLTQVINAGPEQGGQLAAAILTGGTRATVAKLNKTQTQLTSASDWLGNAAAATTVGGTIANHFVAGLRKQDKALQKEMDKLAARLVSQLKGKFRVKGHAAGGTIYAGELALVGEQGPELVQFGRTARVYTAGETRQMQQPAGKAGPTVTVTQHITGADAREVAERSAQAVLSKLTMALATH